MDILEERNLTQMYRKINDINIPVIPIDITFEELNNLFVLTANMYAYVMDSVGRFEIAVRKAKRNKRRAFIMAYINAENTMSNHPHSLLKIIKQNEDVIIADKALSNARNRLKVVEKKLKALASLDEDINNLIDNCLKLKNIEHSLKSCRSQYELYKRDGMNF